MSEIATGVCVLLLALCLCRVQVLLTYQSVVSGAISLRAEWAVLYRDHVVSRVVKSRKRVLVLSRI